VWAVAESCWKQPKNWPRITYTYLAQLIVQTFTGWSWTSWVRCGFCKLQ
jgi:hypothetical protein